MSGWHKKTKHIVKVTWGDAHALGDSWGKFEPKDHKTRRVASVGFVLQDDEVGISITQSVDTENHDDHGLFIPRCNIEKVEDL